MMNILKSLFLSINYYGIAPKIKLFRVTSTYDSLESIQSSIYVKLITNPFKQSGSFSNNIFSGKENYYLQISLSFSKWSTVVIRHPNSDILSLIADEVFKAIKICKDEEEEFLDFSKFPLFLKNLHIESI